MQQNELTLLGKIIKAHGYQGAVVIALKGEFFEKIEKMESVFVESDGIPVPFFIDYIKESGRNSIVVKFDYYDSDLKIGEFIGCPVFSLYDPELIQLNSSLPIEYIGFKIFNINNIDIGTIIKVLSYPMQVMFEIETNSGQLLLIPFNSDWIVEEDLKQRILKIDLPEGLDSLNI